MGMGGLACRHARSIGTGKVFLSVALQSSSWGSFVAARRTTEVRLVLVRTSLTSVVPAPAWEAPRRSPRRCCSLAQCHVRPRPTSLIVAQGRPRPAWILERTRTFRTRCILPGDCKPCAAAGIFVAGESNTCRSYYMLVPVAGNTRCRDRRTRTELHREGVFSIPQPTTQCLRMSRRQGLTLHREVYSLGRLFFVLGLALQGCDALARLSHLYGFPATVEPSISADATTLIPIAPHPSTAT
eukprot:scaffold2886_cov398-Prasinococcus_capsulatus_cf.AAC.4